MAIKREFLIAKLDILSDVQVELSKLGYPKLVQEIEEEKDRLWWEIVSLLDVRPV